MSIRARMTESAPGHLLRYLTRPLGGTFRERYEAMPDEQKAQERWRSVKRNGFFLAFADLKPRREQRGRVDADKRRP